MLNGDEFLAELQQKHPGIDEEHAALADHSFKAFRRLDQFVASIAPPDWLHDGMIQRRYLYACTAPTQHGKTAWAVYLTTKTGMAGGRVLYLAGENPEDVKGRFKATTQTLETTPEQLSRLVVIREGSAPINSIIQEIREYAEAVGGFDMVVVDTASAFFCFRDENDNVQAAGYARELRELTGIQGAPAVIVLCHPIKNPDRGNLLPRGGGGFLNEVDANLTLWSDGETVEVGYNKMRGPGFDPFKLAFERVILDGLQDSKGRPVVSVVARPITDEEAHTLERKRNEDETRVLWAMLHHPNDSLADWASSCGWGSNKTKVHRIIKRLKEDRLVKQYRNRSVLTELGKDEARNAD